MRRKTPHLDPMGIKTVPLQKRRSKVSVRDCSTPYRRGSTFKVFLDTLPNTLAARDLNSIAGIIAGAHRAKRQIIFGMGAHVIKVGLSPLIIDLMERRLLSCVALNGAGAIHDVEMALAGKTSEDVAAGLAGGTFGMAAEAAVFINRAVAEGQQGNKGMGRAVGDALLHRRAPHTQMSILAAAARLGIPCTVHVSIGSDTIHMHPTFDGAATGRASHNDFLTFADRVSRLSGGVFVNIGSAVVLPEVFLKAFSLAANLGKAPRKLTTVNMDFIRHYRPSLNVVERPTLHEGKGFNLIGHHEIMLPLLAAAVLEKLAKDI
jgi:hypothetical protein